MMRLVAEAHGECWDSEDEQKEQSREKNVALKSKGNPVTENAVQVGPACEISVREGEVEGDVVQAGNDCREKQLQTQQGLEGGVEGGVAQKEEGAEKKKPKVSDPDVGLEGAKPEPKKKKRVRKRPVLSGKFKNIN